MNVNNKTWYNFIFTFVFANTILKIKNATGERHTPNPANFSQKKGSIFVCWNNICKMEQKVQTNKQRSKKLNEVFN